MKFVTWLLPLVLILSGCTSPTLPTAVPAIPEIELPATATPNPPLALTLGKQTKFSSSTPTCFVGFNLLDKGRTADGAQLKSVVVTVLEAADLVTALREGKVETLGVFFEEGKWTQSICETTFTLEARDGEVFVILSRPWHESTGALDLNNLRPFEWGMEVVELHKGL
jgi:hypothetical protein